MYKFLRKYYYKMNIKKQTPYSKKECGVQLGWLLQLIMKHNIYIILGWFNYKIYYLNINKQRVKQFLRNA